MSYLYAAFGAIALIPLVLAVSSLRGPRVYNVDTAWLLKAMRGWRP